MADNVVPFRLHPGHSNATLREIQAFAAAQSYAALRDNHSDQSADDFVSMAVGHIEGAVTYLAEVGQLNHASDVAGRLSRFHAERDPTKLRARIEADASRNLWVAHVLSGKPTAVLAAEALLKAAAWFLRLNGASDHVRVVIAEAFGDVSDGTQP